MVFAWVRRQRNRNQLNPPITQGDNSQVPNKRNRSGSDVKWTDKAQVILTLLMIGLTFYLFREAQKQTGNATAAVIAANDANELTRRNIESSDKTSKENYDLAKRSFESSIEDAKKRFSIDSSTFQAQMKFFKEGQNQFEITNRPFVQILNIKIDTLLPWKEVYISYNLNNFGKLPAKVVSAVYDIEIGFKGDTTEKITDSILPSVKYIMNDSLVNLVISGNAIIHQISQTNWYVTPWKYSQINEGKMIIYFLGEIKYTNFITKKPYENSFVYKITLNPINIMAIKNEDKEL